MGSRKTLTIGVTINLDHYENLRLEVSGEVDSAEDAGELAQFLESILAQFGRGDPVTAERVDSYRRRVFPGLPREARPATQSTDAMHPPPPDLLGESGPPSPATTIAEDYPQASLAPPATEINPADEAVQEIPVIAEPAPGSLSSPARDPPHTGSDAVPAPACESCRAPVSAAEQKMSRLFTGKTLCRACMKNL